MRMRNDNVIPSPVTMPVLLDWRCYQTLLLSFPRFQMGYIDNNFWGPLGFTHAEKYSLALKKLQDLCGDLAPETIPQSSLQPESRCFYPPVTETSLENFITPMKNEFRKKRGDESFIPIANLTSQAQHWFLGSRVTAIFLRNLLIFSNLKILWKRFIAWITSNAQASFISQYVLSKGTTSQISLKKLDVTDA